jgi:hypothetical protein
MLTRQELYARRCVQDLVLVIEQVPVRAAARMPLSLDHVAIRWIVLWTLLRWERTFLLVGLEGQAIDVWGLTRDVDELIQRKRSQDAVMVGQSERLSRWSVAQSADVAHLLVPLLDQAAAEALALRHPYVGTEHLLLALVAGADPELAALFERHGLTHGRLREMLARLLPDPAEDVLCVLADRPGGPAGATWDSPATGVPRRFGMAIVMLIMTMYAILFAAMKLLDAPPTVFGVIAILFTGVGLGQMLLFRGQYPRAASVWVGACLLPLEVVVVIVYEAVTGGVSEPGADLLMGLVCGATLAAPLGALAGYTAGCLAAGVFLLLERYARRRETPAEIDVLADDDPSAAGTRDGTADHADGHAAGEKAQ